MALLNLMVPFKVIFRMMTVMMMDWTAASKSCVRRVLYYWLIAQSSESHVFHFYSESKIRKGLLVRQQEGFFRNNTKNRLNFTYNTYYRLRTARLPFIRLFAIEAVPSPDA